MIKRTYLFTLIASFVLGYLFYQVFLSHNINTYSAVRKKQQNLKVKILINVKEQNKERELSKKIYAQLERSINLEKLKIYRPSSVKCDRNGYIYILDYSVPEVIKLAENGEIISKFGKGKGKGPGELINPTDYSIDLSGNVFIADPVNGEVIKYNKKGEVIDLFRPLNSPFRITVFNDSSLALMSNTSHKLFHIYLQKKELSAFGEICSEQEKNSIVLDGLITSDSKSNLYYTSNRGSLLLSYDIKGKLNFAVRTVDNTSILPKLIILNNGVMKLPHTFTSLGISVGEAIYILHSASAKDSNQTYIDIYKTNNGQYWRSILLKNNLFSFDFFRNKIYAINDTSLFIYKVKGITM